MAGRRTTQVLSQEERDKLEQQKENALRTAGALGVAAFAAPIGSALPFQNLLGDDSKRKIQIKEATLMYPNAPTDLFSKALSFEQIIPETQAIADARIFGNANTARSVRRLDMVFPRYQTQSPGPLNPELGTYQQAAAALQGSDFPAIEAITVTPAPNPGRFAKDYAEVLADKLGKAKNQLVDLRDEFDGPDAPADQIAAYEKLKAKVNALTDRTPGTAGYVWGNVEEPQYSYARGNFGLGENYNNPNPSVYVSRITADPAKEAKYLYTGDILQEGSIEPRVQLKNAPEELGLSTGPSWGISGRGSDLRAKDISFRKDLIEARGELTTGDIQALLKEKGLPYDFGLVDDGGPEADDVLRGNLERLARAEGISTSQAIQKYARAVPAVGQPSTPPTQAAIGEYGKVAMEKQLLSPDTNFAKSFNLKELGILPDTGSSSTPLYPLPNASKASREWLRPKAAQRLLDRQVNNLIEAAAPVRGMGIGGLAAGGIATIADPAVIDALSKGDYMTAAGTAGINTAIGSAVGGATAKGLHALQAAGAARPAAIIGGALPAVGGVLGGVGLVETGRALNRAYRSRTGKDWATRNEVRTAFPSYVGPMPQVQPRMGTAIKGGKRVQVPYGSVAGERRVGRPWWDVAGSKFQGLLDRFNAGSIIGR